MTSTLTMKKRVNLYLKHRRLLGYCFPSLETGLIKFAKFVDKKGYTGPLTIELAIKWATASKKNTRSAWANRLGLIHRFAKYCKATEPETEIPPLNFFGSARRRPAPYIYSEEEIRDLLQATQHLKPIHGIKAITFKYLLGLLASTGLRISEAIQLTCEDTDLKNGILTIRETKFHKSRWVVLHPTVCQALQDYALLRNKKSASSCSTFFITDGGDSLTLAQSEKDFKWLREKLGWTQKPRLYDFRHTFVCRRLLKWYEEGKNIDVMIIYLSTYLGHVRPPSTYWYITAIPELLSIVSSRFEKFTRTFKENNHG